MGSDSLSDFFRPALVITGLFTIIGAALLLRPFGDGPSGHGAGFAIIILYLALWGGFVLSATGLAMPPGNGYSAGFTGTQRRLFALAAVAGALGAVVPVVGFPVLFSHPQLYVYGFYVAVGIGPVLLVVGLGWRGIQVLRSHTAEGL
ncbi:hypothetical protein [Haloarcula halophila]|uniref:hypothetical protein n=1 Tax=Haloarcula TaxID=2237 RepID=UPI0023E3AF31|nr:hypothetical protein [Halomicroarcula sp. DFY41]